MVPVVREAVPSALGERPVLTAVAAVVLLGVLRGVEVLAGVHDRVGALVVSAALVLGVALALVRTGIAPATPGVPTRPRVRRALVAGAVGVGAVQAAAHALEVGALTATGRDPSLVLSAVNPVTKSTAPEAVGVYLLFGVVAVALGQELLFRGVLLGALARRLPFAYANVCQGALFGAWHLAWPLAIALSPARPVAPLPVYAAGTVLVTGTVGAVYGVLARATGTVLAPVLAHLLHNLVAVFVHVRTAGGADQGSALSAGLVAGYVALAWAAHRRWGTGSRSEGLSS